MQRVTHVETVPNGTRAWTGDSFFDSTLDLKIGQRFFFVPKGYPSDFSTDFKITGLEKSQWRGKSGAFEARLQLFANRWYSVGDTTHVAVLLAPQHI